MRIVIACILLVLLCVPVFAAQATTDHGLKLSIGQFYLSDDDASDVAGNGLAINLEKKVYSLTQGDVFASIGYTGFSNDFHGIDVDAHFIPVMASIVSGPARTEGKGLYYGLGLGLSFTKIEADAYDDDSTDFAYQLFGGWKFGEKYFAEAKYFNGNVDANTGFSINVGAQF